MCVKNRLDVRVVSGDIDAYIVKRGRFLVTYVIKHLNVAVILRFINAYILGNNRSAVKFVIGHSDRRLT
jgi:hypothetical protein